METRTIAYTRTNIEYNGKVVGYYVKEDTGFSSRWKIKFNHKTHARYEFINDINVKYKVADMLDYEVAFGYIK